MWMKKIRIVLSGRIFRHGTRGDWSACTVDTPPKHESRDLLDI
jgi:hypothetical protein